MVTTKKDKKPAKDKPTEDKPQIKIRFNPLKPKFKLQPLNTTPPPPSPPKEKKESKQKASKLEDKEKLKTQKLKEEKSKLKQKPQNKEAGQTARTTTQAKQAKQAKQAEQTAQAETQTPESQAKQKTQKTTKKPSDKQEEKLPFGISPERLATLKEAIKKRKLAAKILETYEGEQIPRIKNVERGQQELGEAIEEENEALDNLLPVFKKCMSKLRKSKNRKKT